MALPPVPVRPNPRFGEKIWPIGPRHIDVYKESYQAHRQLDPLWSFDYRKRNGDFALETPAGKTIEPWKVVVIYSRLGLSNGWEKLGFPYNAGYADADALKIGANMIIYSMMGH